MKYLNKKWATAWVATFLMSTAFGASRSPNVVLILADDLGYGDLGCYGATRIKTPNIDRIAKTGMRFTDAYAPGAICSPSRYAIMTGRYDWRTGEKCGVINWDAPYHLEPGRPTLGTLFQNSGYRTGYFGKWHLGFGMRHTVDWDKPLMPGPLEAGFDSFYGLPANHENVPYIYVEGHAVVDRIPGEKVRLEGTHPKWETRGVSPLRDKFECGPRVADKAVEFIESVPEGQPFFLYYSSVEPHIPITPSDPFKGSSECGPYGDFIQQLDHHVGRILSALEAKGVMDNTIILFTSDNGGLYVGESGTLPHAEAARKGHRINGELRGRKHVIYEGGVRVPLIASWAGNIPAGTESAQVVSGVDIIATLGEIIGYPFGHREYIEDSFSIAPVLLGNQPIDEPVRPPVVSTSAIGTFMIRDGEYKVIEERALIPQLMEHVKRHYDGWGGENSKQVYKLSKDITEEQNIFVERQDVYDRLTAYLNRLRRDGSSKGFDPADYPK
ncbi:Arylsulfatase [Pontiella desulfatans]|jgi:arylsulfatase A|uniref:Arylsulfatase n=1 Tax=Pontiella desulfatans TaxID=2750659 RepID=A0A6C2U1S2_PONDE|nr:arylsulfatase [Pontiella desulfatans]SPS73847.1 sulfatase S1_15 [Kiritimatiellales bacterium]VGO13604.1 Arylsulfatase [Pontiella desulfatans]